LSQEQLAERAELHWTYVSGVERGRRNPSLNILARLAQALGLSLPQLVANLRPSAPLPHDRRR
jgi:transcriptional regulator with XRE-family HTH domain